MATGTANGGYKKTFINNAFTYSLVSDAIAVRRDPISGNDIVTGDRLTNIENIIGSRFRDSLTGNDNDNIFMPGLGRTNITFGHGFDRIDGAGGNDLLIIDYSEGDDATAAGLNGSVQWTSGLSSRAFYTRFNNDNSWRDRTNAFNIERYHITGTSRSDSFTGFDRDDTLVGGAGNSSSR